VLRAAFAIDEAARARPVLEGLRQVRRTQRGESKLDRTSAYAAQLVERQSFEGSSLLAPPPIATDGGSTQPTWPIDNYASKLFSRY
jgi:hypothetical protein